MRAHPAGVPRGRTARSENGRCSGAIPSPVSQQTGALYHCQPYSSKRRYALHRHRECDATHSKSDCPTSETIMSEFAITADPVRSARRSPRGPFRHREARRENRPFESHLPDTHRALSISAGRHRLGQAVEGPDQAFVRLRANRFVLRV